MGLQVPDRVRVKLRYSDVFTVTNTSGSVNYQRFRGNSLFDPDQTGTGTQPSSFDQWSAFYYNYVVHGSAIQMRFVESDAGAGGINKSCWYYGVFPTGYNTGTQSTIQDVEETPYAKTQWSSIYTNTMPGKNVNSYMSSNKMLGVHRKAIGTDVTYAATVGASPSNQWYWNTFVVPWDISSTTGGFSSFRLTYYAEFFGRIPLAHS